MQSAFDHFRQLLKQLSQNTGAALPLNNNACTLVDDSDNIVVVIELPEDSDLLLLHRMLIQWPADEALRNARAMQLLSLNGEPDKMQGSWFCTDPESFGIHLMTSCSIETLSYEAFEQLLLNFVDLGKTLATELQDEELELANRDAPASGIQA